MSLWEEEAIWQGIPGSWGPECVEKGLVAMAMWPRLGGAAGGRLGSPPGPLH